MVFVKTDIIRFHIVKRDNLARRSTIRFTYRRECDRRVEPVVRFCQELLIHCSLDRLEFSDHVGELAHSRKIREAHGIALKVANLI